MALLEEALFSRITGNVTLAGLIGTRCYPLVAPEGAEYPLIVYQIISESRIDAHFNPDLGHGQTGLVRSRVQFTVVGKSYGELTPVITVLRSLFDAWKGTITIGVDTFPVEHSFLDNFSADYGQSGENYQATLDVFIMYRKEVD